MKDQEQRDMSDGQAVRQDSELHVHSSGLKHTSVATMPVHRPMHGAAGERGCSSFRFDCSTVVLIFECVSMQTCLHVHPLSL